MSTNSEQAISLAEARAIAKKARGEEAEVLDYSLEPYSKDKLGFLGSHQKLTITLKSSSKRQLQFFVKAVPRESREQTEFVKQRRVFEHEAAFFQSVQPLLLEAIATGDDVEPWAPDCYLAKDEAIVLEDVRQRGFAMSELKVFRGASLLSVVATMARLHAASLLAERKLGQRFDKYCPQACSEQLFVDVAQMRDWAEFLYADEIEKVAERCERGFKNVKAAVRRAYDYFGSYESKHRVINHGDAWSNNVMLDDGRPTPRCLLVDYQMVRYASGMYDLAQLMYLTTRREERAKVERRVVESYWQEVCLTLEKCDPTLDKPELELLRREYEDARLSALLNAVAYMPVILIKPEVFAEYEAGALFKKLVFRRDNECVLEMMERDREYAERMEETVLEFLERAEELGYCV